VNEKQIMAILQEVHSSLGVEHTAKFLYLLKAWKILSDGNAINPIEVTFEEFYNQKIDAKKLQSTIEKLSKSIKVFELFLNQSINISKINDDSLIKLFTVVNDGQDLLAVNDMFYSLLEGYYDFSVANQIAELGVKLLDGDCKELYVPFSNGFNFAYYTDKMIFAESFSDEYILELMRVIESVNINFKRIDPLEQPSFINENAPHLLKQFDCVLSFPPMGMTTSNKFLDTDKFNRFKFHKAKSSRDIAHFEHILAQTKGKAVVLMSVGFTYRAMNEEAFRKSIIDENILEAIVQLPPNLHNATSIETTFFIINKNKKIDKVLFINLKDEQFIKRDGRKLVLKDINDIINIYNNQEEIENISALVSNEEIANGNYSLAIDRYVLSKEAARLKKLLSNYDLVQLDSLAEIRRSQSFKDEEEGKEVYELSPSDLAEAGFTVESGKLKQIGTQYKKLETYKVQPYDVLLSTKGTIGKVGIVGEISESIITSQALQVIRVHGENKKEMAIELYMFLKSSLGQSLLKQLVAGVAMPLISTAEIKQLQIPVLTDVKQKETILNFHDEIKMYNEINKIHADIEKIHNNFLGTK
jgi:type I restriction enzyme M protein